MGRRRGRVWLVLGKDYSGNRQQECEQNILRKDTFIYREIHHELLNSKISSDCLGTNVPGNRLTS
jgi:hypothetical protein